MSSALDIDPGEGPTNLASTVDCACHRRIERYLLVKPESTTVAASR